MPKGSRDNITKQGITNLYSKGVGSVADAAGQRMGQSPRFQEAGTHIRERITNPRKNINPTARKKDMFK